MTTYTWKSATSGSWTDAANWAPSGGPAPIPSDPPPLPGDVAVFSTGSASNYAVTTGGPSAALQVSGDHVDFVNFTNGLDGYGGGLTLDGGAVATFDATSRLLYESNDGLGGGAVDVSGATLLDDGLITAGSASINSGGMLNESGLGASIVLVNGIDVSGCSSVGVSDGATFRDQGSAATIDGHFLATGPGSYAQLADAAGSGTVEVDNHGQVVVTGTASGTLRFAIGDVANLTFSGPLGSGNTITFTGEGGSATLYQGSPGLIVGFDQSDALIVPQAVTGATWTAAGGGSLQLLDGQTPVETLRLQGDYSGATFNAVGIGEGENKITFQPSTTAPVGPTGGPGGVQAAAGNATLGSGASLGSFEAVFGSVGGSFSDVAWPLPGVVVGQPTVSGVAAVVPGPSPVTQMLSDGSAISFVGVPH